MIKGIEEMHEQFMRRCFDLARFGAQHVSPNPMVGAVLVHENQIIGEGYHHKQGEPHAEVNTVASVNEQDKSKIPESTLYVSLEPCCHYGLTPPCTDLIMSQGIKQVVVSTTDQNPKVSGKGVQTLRDHGIEVISGILEEEGKQLLRNFRRWVTEERPYIIIKFVQSKDHYIGHSDYQVWLSNNYEKVLVHKLRSEIDGIMVGTNTAIIDDPQLSNREYFGNNPTRIILDRSLRIPKSHHVFDGSTPTIVFTETESEGNENLEFVKIPFDEDILQACFNELGNRKIQSVLVEGGAALINSLIKSDLWDEAWVVTTQHILEGGIKAPLLHGHLMQKFALDTDEIQIVHNKNSIRQ